jgi:aspartate ammonia-lyase
MDRCPHGLILSQQSCHQCESARATGAEHKVKQLQAENERLKARVRDSVGCIQRIERTTGEQDVRDIIDEYKDNIK